MQPWISPLTSLSLRFLINKLEGWDPALSSPSPHPPSEMLLLLLLLVMITKMVPVTSGGCKV